MIFTTAESNNGAMYFLLFFLILDLLFDYMWLEVLPDSLGEFLCILVISSSHL